MLAGQLLLDAVRAYNAVVELAPMLPSSNMGISSCSGIPSSTGAAAGSSGHSAPSSATLPQVLCCFWEGGLPRLDGVPFPEGSSMQQQVAAASAKYGLQPVATGSQEAPHVQGDRRRQGRGEQQRSRTQQQDGGRGGWSRAVSADSMPQMLEVVEDRGVPVSRTALAASAQTPAAAALAEEAVAEAKVLEAVEQPPLAVEAVASEAGAHDAIPFFLEAAEIKAAAARQLPPIAAGCGAAETGGPGWGSDPSLTEQQTAKQQQLSELDVLEDGAALAVARPSPTPASWPFTGDDNQLQEPPPPPPQQRQQQQQQQHRQPAAAPPGFFWEAGHPGAETAALQRAELAPAVPNLGGQVPAYHRAAHGLGSLQRGLDWRSLQPLAPAPLPVAAAVAGAAAPPAVAAAPVVAGGSDQCVAAPAVASVVPASVTALLPAAKALATPAPAQPAARPAFLSIDAPVQAATAGSVGNGQVPSFTSLQPALLGLDSQLLGVGVELAGSYSSARVPAHAAGTVSPVAHPAGATAAAEQQPSLLLLHAGRRRRRPAMAPAPAGHAQDEPAEAAAKGWEDWLMPLGGQGASISGGISLWAVPGQQERGQQQSKRGRR